MGANVIVLTGPTRVDLASVHEAADAFGWAVNIAETPGDVALIDRDEVVAILFHRDAFSPRYSWCDAIRFLHALLPGVPIIAMRGFSEAVDWPQLSDAGAFHSLWLPLKESEVRQSFGFLSSTRQRPERIPAARAMEMYAAA